MEEADIVVIGAGSGGCAAASRLSDDGRFSVALLEAGGRNAGLRTRVPGMLAFPSPRSVQRFETLPQPGLNGRRGGQPRGRGLGGSSAVNAMIYIRGHPSDYDYWAALGCAGWGWDDVLPWFRHIERNSRGGDDWHGGAGPLWVSDQRSPNRGSIAFVEAAEAIGIAPNADFNGPGQEGAGLFQVTQRRGERWSAARAYLGPHHDRLSIVTDAQVERVLFEDGRAWGVAYQQDGEARVIRAREAVVLAAGAFQTPQLLMLSGIGPGDHLREFGIPVRVERPAVGGNLQDHVDYAAAFETRRGPFLGAPLLRRTRGGLALLQWLVARRGAMTSPYAEAGAFLRVDPAAEVPDVQLHFLPVIVENHGQGRAARKGFSIHACVLRPASRGTVRLQSLESTASPSIDPGFLTDPNDLELLMHGVRAIYHLVATPPLAQFQPRDRHPVNLADDAALEQVIRARADTIYHPVGTCRMGSDQAAVLDPRLRVRGVERLYVADASAMPALIGGNTNAATMMIGERCAAFVAEDLRRIDLTLD